MRYIMGINLKDSETGEQKDFGPYWITGMSLDTGVKIYLYDRMSVIPKFVNIGMLIGTFGFRFEQDFSDSAFVPLEMWLYIGFGGRL
jgi:hypothetical protein